MRSGTKRMKQMRKTLRALAPRIPFADAEAVLRVALSKHLNHLPPTIALWQAATSHIRHVHTDYDDLLSEGYDRDAARHFVQDAMNDVLFEWGCNRFIDDQKI